MVLPNRIHHYEYDVLRRGVVVRHTIACYTPRRDKYRDSTHVVGRKLKIPGLERCFWAFVVVAGLAGEGRT
ncbi:MAG TPA: hypothetical protein VE134_04055, partial [Methanomicrobiales archaeon]|nr:hypothetical protein [Methanomicrobiales archaeon]